MNQKLMDLLNHDKAYTVEDGVYKFVNSQFHIPAVHRLDEITDLIIQWYQLRNDEDTKNRVKRLFVDSDVMLHNVMLTAENEMFIDRFNFVNMDYDIDFIRHYMGKSLLVNQRLFRNIRIRNNGFSTWSSERENPIVLSYHWYDKHGNTIVFEGIRTALLADLKAGREMTIPLEIQTPDQPGEYVLEVVLLHEYVKWLDQTTLKVNLFISDQLPDNSCLFTENTDKFTEKWDDDHSIEILKSYIQAHFHGTMNLLEIGGSAIPKVTDLIKAIPEIDIHAVNTDVSMSLLKLGQMHFQCNDKEILNHVDYVCCDANDPPFKEKTFDGIIMFRVLHHFEDLEEILLSCRKLLKDHGFIALMCEPVGHAFDSATIKLIEKGVNEQVFSIEEYLYLFEKVGLKSEVMQIDFKNSLKTILVK